MKKLTIYSVLYIFFFVVLPVFLLGRRLPETNQDIAIISLWLIVLLPCVGFALTMLMEKLNLGVVWSVLVSIFVMVLGITKIAVILYYISVFSRQIHWQWGDMVWYVLLDFVLFVLVLVWWLYNLEKRS